MHPSLRWAPHPPWGREGAEGGRWRWEQSFIILIAGLKDAVLGKTAMALEGHQVDPWPAMSLLIAAPECLISSCPCSRYVHLWRMQEVVKPETEHVHLA